jgi:hypothetical protein
MENQILDTIDINRDDEKIKMIRERNREPNDFESRDKGTCGDCIIC